MNTIKKASTFSYSVAKLLEKSVFRKAIKFPQSSGNLRIQTNNKYYCRQPAEEELVDSPTTDSPTRRISALVEESSSRTRSISKSWASAILKVNKIQREEGVECVEKGLKRTDSASGTKKIVGNPTNSTTANNKRPSAFRRRLEDMSWTKEPMDDKLIWVDCEMTGLDYNKEMIMEIGIVITDPNLNEIARQPSIVVHVPDEKLNSMDAWCLKHHGDSGLTESCRQSSLTSEEVDEQLFRFVQKYTKTKECPMAGNSIYMDRIFISKQFPKFHAHFHYRNIDVSSIKELVRRWFPDEYVQAPKKKFSHRVLDDIIDSIAELKYYRSSVFRDAGSSGIQPPVKQVQTQSE